MSTESKIFLIFDANSIVHRAYHALPPLTTKKGELVNAAYGFLLVFLKALKDFQPDYVVAAFDLPYPTFRHKKYKEYKAKRPPTPENLSLQIPKIKEILKAFDVPIFEKEGFEADDIIGTLASLEKEKVKNIIVSGDLDLLQLVDGQTKVYHLRKGVKDTVLYDQRLAKERFEGLSPKQILDFKALRGDPSDNIPGVTGVGEKTAIELIKKFGTLENLYQKLEPKEAKASSCPFADAREQKDRGGEELKPKLKEILLGQKDQAFLSKFLAQIDENVPLNFSLEKCAWENCSREKATQVLRKFEFYSLINRLFEQNKERKSKERGRKNKEKAKENLKLW